MELTEKQKVGLDTALFRYNHGLGYTVISGYAGTGKSTLVKFIVSALQHKMLLIISLRNLVSILVQI